MIKVFTTNKNGKIELTKDELKSLLDDAYWEGYRNNNKSWVYTSPSWSPYTLTYCNAANATSDTAATNVTLTSTATGSGATGR